MEFFTFIAIIFLLINVLRVSSRLGKMEKKFDQFYKWSTRERLEKASEKPSEEPFDIKNPYRQPPPTAVKGKTVETEPVEEVTPAKKPPFQDKSYLVKDFLLSEAKPTPKPIDFKKNQIKSSNVVKNTAKKKKPSFMERNPDLEKFIGENLLSKVGIVIFVIGMGFLVKLGIDNEVINEGMRVAIGVIIGGGMIGLAHYLRVSFSKFSSILIGGALSVLYFTIALAFHEYHLIPQIAAFTIMVLITILGIILSLSYDRIELAVLAIIGGFGTPFFLSDGSGNVTILLSYILILDIGMLILVYFKKWNLINYIAYVFTYALFIGVFYNYYQFEPDQYRRPIFIGLTSIYLVFFLMSIIYNVKNKIKFEPKEIGILISNSAIYFGFGLAIFNDYKEGLYSGLFTALVAFFNFIFCFVLYKKKDIDSNLLYLLIGLVLTFVSLIAPIQLDGNNITLFWSIEGVLLLWLSKKSGLEILKGTAIIINILMIISLALDWQLNYFPDGEYLVLNLFLNKAFITSLTVLISLFVSLKLMQEEEMIQVKGIYIIWKKFYLKILLGIILFLGIYLELDYQLTKFEFAIGTKHILLGIYNSIFAISLIYFERFNKNNYLKIATDIISGALIFTYVTSRSIVAARNSYIQQEESFAGFMWHYLLLILLIFLVVNLSKNIFNRITIKSPEGRVYLWVLGLITLIVLSSEIMHLSIFYQAEHGTAISDAKRLATKSIYPIVWSVCAFAFMIVGMKFRLKTIRIISLMLFLITIIKLFVYDLADSTTGKIVSFIFLGVVLLLISFLYQKLKFIIQDDDEDKNSS